MTHFSLGAEARFCAIRAVQDRSPRKFDPARDDKGRRLRISDYFACNVFTLEKMQEKLLSQHFLKLKSSVDSGKKLDPEVAQPVADAIREWALSRGVSHFCHWFQPQTGLTAEKHDAFISFDAHQKVIEKFSASQLIQSEPDASSFPSGGMRTTFEARGYTAWDPSSPCFIMENANGKTLCVPSVFMSYHGDSLDEKTGLLRSIEILSSQMVKLLRLIGDSTVRRVTPALGIEQEYFLIDRAFYVLRPDLILSGRTLIGEAAAKGQQLEDHYFGSIPARVLAFMTESEHELYKLGIPVKTRHNEVAPMQFELAPIFEEANLATDHNQLTMEILRKVAARHHFAVLLHEKPFSGINGSGKHNNWSMVAFFEGEERESENLLEPGKTPEENIRFLLCLAGVLKGVFEHSGLLRAAIASAGNDHRLGANEAPPAIISVFMGRFLTEILDEIEGSTGEKKKNLQAMISLGVGKIPELMRDSTDRNRTSPFAFTGNKFEFRAVGSSASPAFPVAALNAAVTEGINYVTSLIRKFLNQGTTLELSAFEVVRQVLKETHSIRFEGNNYSPEWASEASKRGLPNLRKTPEALSQLVSAKSISLFEKTGVFSAAEIQSRYHVLTERYVKSLMIEVDTLRSLVDTFVLPAALKYFGELALGMGAVQAQSLPEVHQVEAEKLGKTIQDLQKYRAELNQLIQRLENLEGETEKAELLSSQMCSLLEQIRIEADRVESQISDDLWPLPKYREMLFLS